MATTVKQAFETLRANLEITDLQSQTVSTRQQAVRKAVEDELVVLNSFLTGSYSRSTMIAPLKEADIDIFIILDSQYYEPDGQASLLDRVKRVLRETYTRTPEISRNGQAVTITFDDFMVDVVPAFNRRGGGYLIPSTYGGGRWIATDPKKHIEISSAANAAHNGDLVPLVKMIKCWNRTIDKLFRSFHLEVLAWRIFDDAPIPSFPSGIRYFFDKGKDLISQQHPDPAGYGGNVGYYIDTREKVEQAESRFITACTRALVAEDFDRQGYVRYAIEEWRRIFSSAFPAYG